MTIAVTGSGGTRPQIFWRGYVYLLLPAALPFVFEVCDRYLPQLIAQRYQNETDWLKYVNVCGTWDARFEGAAGVSSLFWMGFILLLTPSLLIPRVHSWLRFRVPYAGLIILLNWALIIWIPLIPHFTN